jgi:hypothetical protein
MLLTTRTGEELFDGVFVFDTSYGTAVSASKSQVPLIMSDGGDLIWHGPEEATFNFHVQTYNGESVLTYYSGAGTAGASAVVGHGYGQVIVLDNKYEEIARLCLNFSQFTMETVVTADCHADVHESYITSRNTMLVTASNTA